MKVVAIEGVVSSDTQNIAKALSQALGFEFISLSEAPSLPKTSKGIIVVGEGSFQLFKQVACKIFLYPNEWNEFTQINSGTIFWAYPTDYEKIIDPLSNWVLHHLREKSLFISVIVPVYNRQNHIGECVKALFQQTLPTSEYEVIVVDDGSRDSSGLVAQKNGAQVIRIPHRGPGAARNAGVQQARGDIIAFIDCDIIVLENYLEELRQRHCWSNALLLLGARRHLPEGIESYKDAPLNLDSREKLLRRYSFCLTHLNSPWSVAYTCNFSVSKNFLGESRFDETFVGWGLEDIDLAYRLYQKGIKTVFSRAIVGYHLYHDRKLSPSRFLIWLQNLNRFLEKYSDPRVKAFSLFKKVFDPGIRGDYFMIFDQFEGHSVPKRDLEIVDVTEIKKDPIDGINKKLQTTENDLFLLGFSHHALLDVYLPFLNSKRIYGYIPKEDWSLVAGEFKEQMHQAKHRLIGEEICEK